MLIQTGIPHQREEPSREIPILTEHRLQGNLLLEIVQLLLQEIVIITDLHQTDQIRVISIGIVITSIEVVRRLDLQEALIEVPRHDQIQVTSTDLLAQVEDHPLAEDLQVGALVDQWAAEALVVAGEDNNHVTYICDRLDRQ